jgi:hypothetical protein
MEIQNTFLMSLLLVIATPPSYGEDPTEAETAEFIETMLTGCEASRKLEDDFPRYRELRISKTYDYHEFSVKDGMLNVETTITETLHGKTGRGNWEHAEVVRHWDIGVALSELDPNVEQDGRLVRVHCSSSECFSAKVMGHGYLAEAFAGDMGSGYEDDKTYTTNTTLLCNQRDAGRFANAMKHLIELNGGEASPF